MYKGLKQIMSEGTKILIFIIFIVSVILIPEKNFHLYLSHLFIIAFSFLYFRIKFTALLKRLTIGFPFIIIISLTAFLNSSDLQEKFWVFLSIIIKYSFVFLWGLIVFADIQLHKGLKQLHIPNLFISLITLMEKFLFIFKSEISRIIRAVEIRTFKKNKFIKITLAKNISSAMLIRGFERSQRIYNAMTIRGFDGDVRFILDKKLGLYDIYLLTIFAIIIISINVIF
jgi:cobalt/nickel transport system permease protein